MCMNSMFEWIRMAQLNLNLMNFPANSISYESKGVVYRVVFNVS